MPFVPDQQATKSRFVPDAPVRPVSDIPKNPEPRMSGQVGENVVSAIPFIGEDLAKDFEGFGRSYGLSMEEMLQAIRQYTTGAVSPSEKKAAIEAAAEIKREKENIPTGRRLAGEVTSSMIPFGSAGRLATGAKTVGQMNKAERAAQAMKTIGAGGAATAALTPVSEEGDFAKKKLEQFEQGALGTAILGGLASGAKGLYQAGKSILSPEERAAVIAKLSDKFGFGGHNMAKVSETAGKSVSETEKSAKDFLEKEGLGTAEKVGNQAKSALSLEEKGLLSARQEATEKIKQDALSQKNPINTQEAIKFLQYHKANDPTPEGKRLYDSVIASMKQVATGSGNELKWHINQNALEPVKGQLEEKITRGFEGVPVSEGRAKVLKQAKDKLMESAGSKWNEYFEKYKEMSAPLDAFRRQEGSEIGKITKVDPISQQAEMPPEKVVDHIIDGGMTRVRAAVKAAGQSAPEVKDAIEKRMWQQMKSKAENGKLTSSSIDTFMKDHQEVIKELGLDSKFEAARSQLKAADAIEKTAIGKLAKSGANPTDAFNSLGKILDSGEGQRLSGLKELSNLTKNDPEARQALKRGIVMQMVTQTPQRAATQRLAVIPDLKESGLFSAEELSRLNEINAKFDQIMKIGGSERPTTVAEDLLMRSMKAVGTVVPFHRPIGAFLRGGMDKIAENSLNQTRNLLLQAAVDPEAAKALLSVPTPQNVENGLSAMQRAGIFMTVHEAIK